jgi:SAM-dependent methyltransferase
VRVVAIARGAPYRGAVSSEKGEKTAGAEWWKGFFDGPVLDVWRGLLPPAHTVGEADDIVSLLGVQPGARILDVPCGHGRLTLELAARGYAMTGLDGAPDEIAYANARAGERKLSADLAVGDMRDFAFPKPFDGIFCFGNSFGYFDDDDNQRFLVACARALPPGKKLLVDTFTAETLIPNLQERAWWKVGDTYFLAERRLDVLAGRLEIGYTFLTKGQEVSRPASYRVYAAKELLAMFRKAGFEPEARATAAGDPPRLGSRRFLVIATRVAS